MLSKITESSCHQGFEPLTVYWGQIVGPNFRRLNNDKSTNCILYAMTLALNQRDSKKGQLHTIQSIRSMIAENIINLKDEQTTPSKKGRKGWEMLLDHYRFLFKDKFKDVYSLTELKDFMKSDAHQLSLIDFIMISQLYEVKFIIMSRKRSPFNPSGFICLGSTSTENDSYILLYKVEWEDYQIVGNTGFSPAKYIFTKEELPTKLYQHWAEVCGKTDMKEKPDEQIPALLKAPLYKSFEIAPSESATGKIKIGLKAISAKTYFVDPTTDEVLPQQTTKKIPIKPKLPILVKKAEEQEEQQKLKDQVIKIVEQKKIPIGLKR